MIFNKMKVLYIDTTNSGISGDRFISSLLGLIPNPNDILNEIQSLKNLLPGVSKLYVELEKVFRFEIKVNQLKIVVKESKNHRKAELLKNTLNKYLENNTFSIKAKNYAMNVLNSMIQAEMEIHGELLNKIHLHELSSVDTLIDILGSTRALDILGVFKEDFRVFTSVLPLGGGSIKGAHGLLPVPAPATLHTIQNSNLIVKNGPIEDELVTPTGAALLTNLNPIVKSPKLKIEKVVYSTGQKKFENFLNVLRVSYGVLKKFIAKGQISPFFKKYKEKVSVIETNIDDVSGEIIGNFITIMESKQILDIQVLQSITKKNRPGYVIKILCHPKDKYNIIQEIINELGTLGVRYYTINRIGVERKIEKFQFQLEDKYYEIKYKISYINKESGKKIINIKPEYEDLKNISQHSGYPVKKLEFIIQSKLFEEAHKNNKI